MGYERAQAKVLQAFHHGSTWFIPKIWHLVNERLKAHLTAKVTTLCMSHIVSAKVILYNG